MCVCVCVCVWAGVGVCVGVCEIPVQITRYSNSHSVITNIPILICLITLF